MAKPKKRPARSAPKPKAKAAPKPAPKPRAAPAPEPRQPPPEPPPAVTLGDLMDALAKVSGRLAGAECDDMRRHVGEVRQHVSALVDTLGQRGEPDEQARRAAAAEVERLIEAVAKTGT